MTALHLSATGSGQSSASSSRRRRGAKECTRADSEVLMLPEEDGEGVVYRKIPEGREEEVGRAILRRDFVFLRSLPEAEVQA